MSFHTACPCQLSCQLEVVYAAKLLTSACAVLSSHPNRTCRKFGTRLGQLHIKLLQSDQINFWSKMWVLRRFHVLCTCRLPSSRVAISRSGSPTPRTMLRLRPSPIMPNSCQVPLYAHCTPFALHFSQPLNRCIVTNYAQQLSAALVRLSPKTSIPFGIGV